MRPENCWAAQVAPLAARLHPQSRARKLGDNFPLLKKPDAKSSRLPLSALQNALGCWLATVGKER
jgi:hypothetical protein